LKDYYEVLGVPHEATSQEIKNAYRQLALRFHPDRNTQNDGQKLLAEEKFRQIAEAYETLGNDRKRRQYDFYVSHHLRNDPTKFETYTSQVSQFRPAKGKCGRGMGRGFCRSRER
jgi:DnaJ homolog subfamily B member 9